MCFQGQSIVHALRRQMRLYSVNRARPETSGYSKADAANCAALISAVATSIELAQREKSPRG